MARVSNSLTRKSSVSKKVKWANEDAENEKVNREREKRELERKRETERMGKMVERKVQTHLPQDMKGEHFPLKQAVVLSEIVGDAKCKTRHKKRR